MHDQLAPGFITPMLLTPGTQLPAGPQWLAQVKIDGVDVLLITYGCHVDRDADVKISHEHKQAGLFILEEVGELPMPEGYRQSIRAWFARAALAAP